MTLNVGDKGEKKVCFLDMDMDMDVMERRVDVLIGSEDASMETFFWAYFYTSTLPFTVTHINIT